MKNIQVIRDSIGRIVAMLTNRSITVTQRGTRAYVKYNAKTGGIESVNIPYLPDSATEEYVAAVQGFLDHEVGHVLFTDPKSIPATAKLPKRVQNMANIIEDVFVERKMAEAFAGSGGNLESTRQFYLHKIAKPAIDNALRAGDTGAATGAAIVAGFRAWGGQVAAQDFIKDPKIKALLQPTADKLGPLIEEIGKCNSSFDCLSLAKRVIAALEKPKVAAPPPSPPPPAAPPPPPAPAPAEPAEPEEQEEEDADAGSTGSEEDDAGQATEQTSGGSDEQDEQDEEGGEGQAAADEDDSDAADEDGAPSDAESEEQPEAGDEDEAESAAPEGAMLDENDAEEGEDAEGAAGDADEDPEGEGADGPVDETDEQDTQDGSGVGSGDEGDVPDEPQQSQDASSTEPEGNDDPSEQAGAAPPPQERDESISSLMDEERDFDKEMADKLTEQGRQETKRAPYRIYSNEWDEAVPGPEATNPNALSRLMDSVDGMVGGMQKYLERAMAAQAKKAWQPGLRRGRIAPGSLFKTAVGDDRVFRQRFETKAKNTAASLLIDCSGSMAYTKLPVAAQAAYALSSVLERLRIVHEITGFTTKDSEQLAQAIRDDAQMGGLDPREFARWEALYLPVFKSFGERLGPASRSRLAHLLENPSWLGNNVDGESVQAAGHRLRQQRAERHVLFVLSDGNPAAHPGIGVESHLKTVVAELAAAGTEVVGIGIMDDSVREFYPKAVVLKDVAELPTTVIAEITKILLAP